MAEQNILDAYQGVTKTFCNFIFNQLRDGVLCLNQERKVIFWNKAAFQLTNFPSEEVAGKYCYADLTLFSNKDGGSFCGETCPALLTFKDGIIRTYDVYLAHKNGFRFPANLRLIPVFKEDGEIIGVTEVFSSTTPKVTIPLRVSELEKSGFIDQDTGIADRRYIDMTMAVRVNELESFGLGFGIIYIDIDNFTRIQEKYGRYNAGKILRTVGLILHKNIRYFDIVGRIGADDFLVILLNIDETRLDIVANKLRLLISESFIVTETGMLNATVSMGACIASRFDTAEALIKRAEQLMRHSKWLGKNRVSLSFTGKAEE